MCDGSLAMINDGGVSVKGGHHVSKCVMVSCVMLDSMDMVLVT